MIPWSLAILSAVLLAVNAVGAAVLAASGQRLPALVLTLAALMCGWAAHLFKLAIDGRRNTEVISVGCIPSGTWVEIPNELFSINPMLLGPRDVESGIAAMARLSADRWIESRGTALPESDHGIDGFRPLPPPEWSPFEAEAITDAQWAEQNRRANALLMGRGAVPE